MSIAIACHFLGLSITKENCIQRLQEFNKKHTSEKILQSLPVIVSQLSRLRDTKASDTKHLNTLLAAKEIISGKKNKSALAA